jgi:predicted tellurium resistance membrane protein TerC
MTTRLIVILAAAILAVVGMVFMGRAMDGKGEEKK